MGAKYIKKPLVLLSGFLTDKDNKVIHYKDSNNATGLLVHIEETNQEIRTDNGSMPNVNPYKISAQRKGLADENKIVYSNIWVDDVVTEGYDDNIPKIWEVFDDSISEPQPTIDNERKEFRLDNIYIDFHGRVGQYYLGPNSSIDDVSENEWVDYTEPVLHPEDDMMNLFARYKGSFIRGGIEVDNQRVVENTEMHVTSTLPYSKLILFCDKNEDDIDGLCEDIKNGEYSSIVNRDRENHQDILLNEQILNEVQSVVIIPVEVRYWDYLKTVGVLPDEIRTVTEVVDMIPCYELKRVIDFTTQFPRTPIDEHEDGPYDVIEDDFYKRYSTERTLVSRDKMPKWFYDRGYNINEIMSRMSDHPSTPTGVKRLVIEQHLIKELEMISSDVLEIEEETCKKILEDYDEVVIKDYFTTFYIPSGVWDLDSLELSSCGVIIDKDVTLKVTNLILDAVNIKGIDGGSSLKIISNGELSLNGLTFENGPQLILEPTKEAQEIVNEDGEIIGVNLSILNVKYKGTDRDITPLLVSYFKEVSIIDSSFKGLNSKNNAIVLNACEKVTISGTIFNDILNKYFIRSNGGKTFKINNINVESDGAGLLSCTKLPLDAEISLNKVDIKGDNVIRLISSDITKVDINECRLTAINDIIAENNGIVRSTSLIGCRVINGGSLSIRGMTLTLDTSKIVSSGMTCTFGERLNMEECEIRCDTFNISADPENKLFLNNSKLEVLKSIHLDTNSDRLKLTDMNLISGGLEISNCKKVDFVGGRISATKIIINSNVESLLIEETFIDEVKVNKIMSASPIIRKIILNVEGTGSDIANITLDISSTRGVIQVIEALPNVYNEMVVGLTCRDSKIRVGTESGNKRSTLRVESYDCGSSCFGILKGEGKCILLPTGSDFSKGRKIGDSLNKTELKIGTGRVETVYCGNYPEGTIL